MLTVLIKILGIFAIIVVGYIATKTNIITKESESSMVNLLILVTTPCMAFSSIVSKELDSSISEKVILVLLVSLAYFIIMPILVLPLGKIFTHTPKEDVGVLMAIMVAANAGFMGFPITKAIFGDHFFFLIVVQNIILNIYLFGIAVLQMNYGSESKFDIKSIIKSVMNPCVVVSLIAMVILFTGIKMPEPVMDITGMLGNVTTPLSMIIVGMRLANSKFDSVLKNRDLIIASLFNVLIAPICAFLMVNWLPFLTDDVKLLIIWASAFPCAVIIAGLAAKEGRNATLVSEGIALTTLLSLITLPIAATILTSLYLH